MDKLILKMQKSSCNEIEKIDNEKMSINKCENGGYGICCNLENLIERLLIFQL